LVDEQALDPDQRVMAQVKGGDRGAFEALYDLFSPRVMAFLYRLAQDRATAEDLTQETFLAVWQAAPRWKPTGKVSTWIFQIAKRLWWKRSASRRSRRAREEAVARRRPPQDDPAPDRLAAQHDEVRRLQDAVGSLTPKLRLAFVLVRLEGLSYAEAAMVADVPAGTVKSRMAAAEARLRAALADGASDHRRR